MTDYSTRLAVIGTGYWGKNLVRNFAEIGVLAAICDSDANVVAHHCANYPTARPFSNPTDVAADPNIDAVAISTPAATHGALVRLFLEAGKQVFVEKPLCLNVEEAEELGRLANDRGLTLMVGHLLLYHPAFQALRAEVDKGRLGKLRYIYSNRASLGKIRTEENALWSFAPHDVSMILALSGRMPDKVFATGAHYITDGVADVTLSHLTFSENLQAHIFVSWLHPFKDHRLVVVGSDAMIVFNDVEQGADKLLFYPHTATTENYFPLVTKADAEPIPYADDEPLRMECHHFLNSIADGARPTSDSAEGLRVLKVLHTCEQAILTGHPVSMIEAKA
jgi:UDP-2-acetamido-3-amino-2,3-dideoxy-glucuronate N-acetyltransferase